MVVDEEDADHGGQFDSSGAGPAPGLRFFLSVTRVLVPVAMT
jgi:hypothetical protein